MTLCDEGFLILRPLRRPLFILTRNVFVFKKKKVILWASGLICPPLMLTNIHMSVYPPLMKHPGAHSGTYLHVPSFHLQVSTHLCITVNPWKTKLFGHPLFSFQLSISFLFNLFNTQSKSLCFYIIFLSFFYVLRLGQNLNKMGRSNTMRNYIQHNVPTRNQSKR